MKNVLSLLEIVRMMVIVKGIIVMVRVILIRIIVVVVIVIVIRIIVVIMMTKSSVTVADFLIRIAVVQ